MRKAKGFTLVEVILVMALMGIVITTCYSVLNFSYKTHKVALDEFDLQASFRLVSEQTNQISRFSTAVFTIPQSSFREDNLTDGWNYFGVMDGAIVAYEYKLQDGVLGHHKRVLVPANPDVSYEIVFKESGRKEYRFFHSGLYQWTACQIGQ
jgi:prepilin-type N-terminal cleavage/methylation domain-containing protein